MAEETKKKDGKIGQDLFNIPITAPEGRIYNLSGPKDPSLLELKQVALRLFEEFTIESWKAELIKRENVKKESEKVKSEVSTNDKKEETDKV